MAKKYYSIQKLKSLGCLYNILTSGRNQGKSYQIKHLILKDAFEMLEKDLPDGEFIYLRRYDHEIELNDDILRYFEDVDIEALTKKRFDHIIVKKRQFFFAKWEIRQKKEKRLDAKGRTIEQVVDYEEEVCGPRIGYAIALQEAFLKKSQVFMKVKNLVFEEFLTRGKYLRDEADELQQFISTVARDRQIQVWMVANKVSRFNPYVRSWSLSRIFKQQEGTIDVYEHHYTSVDGSDQCITVAVECILSENDAGSMAFGKARESIVSGHWETHPHPHIQGRMVDYACSYRIYFRYMELSYIANLLHDTAGNYFWFVYPAYQKDYEDDNGIYHKNEYSDIKRRITDEYENNNYHTMKIVAITPREQFAINLLKLRKIVYSDDLTGEEFEQLLDAMK